MLSPTEAAPASRAPRLAASIRPGPPPVITAKPASPIARPISRARAYCGSLGGVRAEPKTQTAGPISRERLEALAQLRLDQGEPLLVGPRRRDRRLLGADDLLVGVGGSSGSWFAHRAVRFASGARDYLRKFPWKHPRDHSCRSTTAADGTVRALDDRLVIESLTVEDERAAKLVRERAEAGHPPAQTVRDAVEIGARVLEREGTAAEVDYVRAEFERHAAELRERLAQGARVRRRAARRADHRDLRRLARRLGAEGHRRAGQAGARSSSARRC